MLKINKHIIQNFFRLLGRKGLKWLVIGLIASLGIALVELTVSIVIQLLLVSFGFISKSGGMKVLSFLPSDIPIYQVTLVLCLTAAIRFVVQLASTQTAGFLKEYINHRLKQNTVFQMLFSEDMNFRVSSAVNFKISEVFVKSSEFIFNFSLFSSMIVQSGFLLLIMFFIAWKEATFSMVGIFFIGCFVLSINRVVSGFAKKVPAQQKIMNEGIEKIARNFIFIKLVKKREEEFHSIDNALAEYSSQSLRSIFFSNVGAQTGPFLGIILLVGVILLSQGFWHTKPLVLISFIYLLARFVQALSILSGYFGNTIIYFPQFKLALDSIENENFQDNCNKSTREVSVIGLLKTTGVSSIKLNEKSIARISRSSPSIAFKNISFGYPNSPLIFNKLNMTIDAGSQVGMIGPSGTGKSTYLMLLTGILKPISGEILIDNISAQEYFNRKETRVSYVGAEPFLMKGSLRENLCYGISQEVTDEDLFQVLKMVSLEDLLQEKTFDYAIGEDHSGLSAGQKQRVCLARAILNHPSLLILDEATANLDETNEKQVADIIQNLKGKCTTLIVSHRPGILIYADRIIEVKTLLSQEVN